MSAVGRRSGLGREHVLEAHAAPLLGQLGRPGSLGVLRAEAAGPDPAGQLVGLFDALTSACRRDGYRGCAFINAAAESASGTRVHARTVAHKENIRAWLRELAAAAGARNPDHLARSLTLLLDGGLASGVLDADPAAAAAARGAAAQLVAASRKTPPAPS